jgi:nitroreductase
MRILCSRRAGDVATTLLIADELLIATCSVRKRLDFTTPVEREGVAECLAIAQPVPTGSNMQKWHFLNEAGPYHCEE